MGKKNLNDAQADQELTRVLSETGFKDQLREKFIQNLNDTDWRDQVKVCVQDYVKKNRADKITVDDCIKNVSQKAKDMVPDSVNRQLIKDVQQFIEERAEH